MKSKLCFLPYLYCLLEDTTKVVDSAEKYFKTISSPWNRSNSFSSFDFESNMSTSLRRPPDIKIDDLHLVAKTGPQVYVDIEKKSRNKKLTFLYQIFTAFAVSTGCLSYGICMAYTSSAIPSMLDKNSTIAIDYNEATWMSNGFSFSLN